MNTNYMNIFLADDDEDDRLIFCDAFKELNLNTRVQTFNDGLALIEYLNHKENVLPQVLFLDLNMPKKNGIECLHEIKQNSKFDDIIIVIYSTSASENDIEETFVSGANVYIKKPSDFNDLKKILKTIVTMNWQYQNSNLNRQNFLLKF